MVQILDERNITSTIRKIIPDVPNMVDCDVHAVKQNMKWMTDIIELHISIDKKYILPVIDYSDCIPVLWTVGTSSDAELVNDMSIITATTDSSLWRTVIVEKF